ncbi:MAG: hydantoinase/oxoprolinase family protein [Anaerolineae bacterium]|nr:hydantoinase/oxoprolinase family protein [Anaerolineae bacterium]MBL8104023.1 hydantoinase/oxoprolinase family protein [Anaerolineales bacterium]MCC7190788.1 hydantoinase/oxoprolinase family protein [Anaerolineales bacterium]
MPNPSHLLAVDIGGTFTDIVLFDTESNHIAVGKVLTTYPDPSQAVLSGVTQLLKDHNIDPASVRQVIHGTTLVTNTLIERKGAHTALIATEGFRDALEIGNEGRYDIYDLGLVKPPPLVERRLRFGIHERMAANGEVLHPLDANAVAELCKQLNAEGIESVAICLLHAFTNPRHELDVYEIVRDEMPNASISISHQVSPAMREYQRTSTTVANAYVQPITSNYLERIQSGLAQAGLNAPLNVMLSSGGTTDIETATRFPIRLVESGPSGGALAGVYWGKQNGFNDIFAFDMGGTTAKAILTHKSELSITSVSEVAHVHRFKRGSGLPLLVPMIEMIEIGAGGGSVAHVNNLGLPAVGPESAGSTPGPACYARGGLNPTVTDADLLIGYLNADYFANGSIRLDASAAEKAFESLAKELDISITKAAWGIHQLVNENMAAAARVHAAERGLDIQKYAMVTTGGAGPVHASGVAERLNVRTVIVPPIAGVGSAFGFLLAPISFDFTRSYLTRIDQVDANLLMKILRDLESEGRGIVMNAGVAAEDIHVTRSVDMRYLRQGYEIRVEFEGNEINAQTLSMLEKRFEEEYMRFYGVLCEGVPIQAVNWRVVVSGPALEIEGRALKVGEESQRANQPYGSRNVVFNPDNGAALTPVYRRESLSSSFKANGPAIIEEAESTTIVLPNWSARVDVNGCLVLTR